MDGALPWVLGGLAALVALAGLLALAVKRFGRHLATAAQESPLFRRLAEAHALTAEERHALAVMALAQGLADPAALFVSPTSLARGIELLRSRSPAVARAASRLPERLFGAARG